MTLFDELPKNWKLVSLGEISHSIQYGLNEKSSDDNAGILYLRITDIGEDGNLKLISPKYISSNTPQISNYTVEFGDLLIARSGSVGLSYVHLHSETRMVYASYLIRFRLNQKLVDPEYIGFYMRSPFYWQYVNKVARGVTVQNINGKQLSLLPILLPTLPEQREIVKFLRQVDHLRRLRGESDKRTEQILPSIFSKLFQKTQANWISCRLGDVISLETGQNVTAKPFPAEKGKWGVLKVSAVTYGTFLPEENKELPDDFLPDLAYQVKSGDLLITRANTAELAGASAIVRDLSQNLVLPDKIWRAVFDGKYPSNPYFLYGLLNTAQIRNEISRRATGTSGSMKNISQNNFLDIVIWLPPEDEQKRFAEIIKSLWHDVYDRQANAGLQLSDLAKTIQLNAFAGRLTLSYRDKHIAELDKIAVETEQILSGIEKFSNQEIALSIVFRSDTRSKLSISQQSILNAIEEQNSYSEKGTLVSTSQLPPNQVQRNLELLAKTGLIKAVKVSVAPGELGHILFTDVYRSIRPKDDTRTTDLEALKKALDE